MEDHHRPIPQIPIFILSLELSVSLNVPKSTFHRWRMEGMRDSNGRGGNEKVKLMSNIFIKW